MGIQWAFSIMQAQDSMSSLKQQAQDSMSCFKKICKVISKSTQFILDDHAFHASDEPRWDIGLVLQCHKVLTYKH